MASTESSQMLLRRRSLSQSSIKDPIPSLAIPPPFMPKRSVSCVMSSTENDPCVRIRIRYQDEAIYMRAQENARQLLQSALDESNQHSNSVRIAKKALKYRNLLDRMAGIDVNSPSFDASKFLGVTWCKTILLSDASSPPEPEHASTQD